MSPELRRRLHQEAEPAFAERRTNATLTRFLEEHGVTILATDLAGTGILARIGPAAPGILMRADLDALPIPEASGLPHASTTGAHHACGHDGHSAMLAQALAQLASSPVGTVYGLFQPAEETGEGAARVLADPRMDLPITAAYAIHNVPGLALGAVHCRAGPAAVASCGLAITMTGVASHAGEPHRGRSPVRALTELAGDIEMSRRGRARTNLATVVGIAAGGARYGTTPGSGELHATFRADTDAELANMLRIAKARAHTVADRDGLEVQVERVEPFPSSQNDPAAVERVQRAAVAAGLPYEAPVAPAAWSEDFGHVLKRWPGALILLGAGENHLDLHSPAYDFPDALLEPGTRFWVALAKESA